MKPVGCQHKVVQYIVLAFTHKKLVGYIAPQKKTVMSTKYHAMCGGRKNNPSTYHSSGLIQLCLFWLIIRFPLDGLPCFFHRPFIWEPDLGWRFGVLFQTARVGLTKPCMFVWIGWCVRKSWQDRLASQAISWYSYCMYSENDAWHGHWGPIFVVLQFCVSGQIILYHNNSATWKVWPLGDNQSASHYHSSDVAMWGRHNSSKCMYTIIICKYNMYIYTHIHIVCISYIICGSLYTSRK